MADTKNFPFEQQLDKLEEVVKKMESGELSLEESLKAYESGIDLVSNCQEALNQAKQKISILSEKANDSKLEQLNINIDNNDQ